MKPHTHHPGFTSIPLNIYATPTRRRLIIPPKKHRHVTISVNHCQYPSPNTEYSVQIHHSPLFNRRHALLTSLLSIGAFSIHSSTARAQDIISTTTAPPSAAKVEEVINSRIYDAGVIGEPMAVGKDKKKVWEKLMNARIVYLGEAEHVPIRDYKELELEIVKNLRKRCVEAERKISLALEAFPTDLQEQLDLYMDRRLVCFVR